jgi:trimeric autotransporter adhesin
VSIVERIVTVYNDKGSKQAVKDLKSLEKNFIDSGKKIAKAFGVATLAVGAFAAKVGVDAVKGAIEDQKSQALLANALRNTTGATDDAIKSVEDYISAQQMLVAVSDTELRQSLITLTTATGDLTQAQALQNVALDTAAGTTRDLQTVSLAIAKAYNGNIGALTKLGVSIDQTIVKNKDFKGAVDALTKAYGGAAITAADTLEGRLRQLQIAYGEILETLGYALLPVIREFAEYIVANVLPAIQSWVDLNKDNLASGLKTVTENVIALGKAVFGFVDFISRNQTTIKIFASVVAGLFVASKVYAFATAIALLIPTLTAFTAAAGSAGVAGALLTGGFSAGAAAAALGAFAVTAGALGVSFAASAKNANKAGFAFKGMGNISMTTGKQMTGLNKVVATNTNTTNSNTNATKQLTAAEKKAAEVRAAIKKAGLDVFGVKNVSDTDPIQLEAARLNLVKQGNLEELKKVEALMKSAEAQMKVNQNAQKYADILVALADNKISPEEIGILAAKWGMSVAAVTNYLATIFIVNDQKVDDSEVALLAAAWGITKEQAAKYLDFVLALKDQKLSDEEIKKLQDKWGLTYKEVLQYADFVAKLDDFTLSDDEIKKLSDAWGLTKDQVLAYTEQIGAPVSYSGTLIDPAKQAEAGWNSASAALMVYITQLDFAIGKSAAASAAAIAAFEQTAKAVAGAEAATGAANAATAAASASIASSQAAAATAAAAAVAALAQAEAMIEAAEAAAAAADAMAGLTDAEKAEILAGDSPTVGGTGGDRINPNGGDLIALANGGIVTSPTMALIGEAGPEAVIPLSRGGGFGGGITITVNNAGSVIAEADLVSSIRNALLQAQNNGQVITKSAVAI